MPNSADKFVLITTKPNDSTPDNKKLQAYVLPTRQNYTCANHPKAPAICLCAKCGTFLCDRCSIAIGGRRYCESCMSQDEGLLRAFEKEIVQTKIRPNESYTCKTPQTIADLPNAIVDMLKDSSIFFKTAKDAPFGLTFFLAFCALVPNALVCFLFKLEQIVPDREEFKAILPVIREMPTASLVCAAIVMTLMQILLLDLTLFASMRCFSQSQMSFKQVASVLHFCLLPMFFTVFGSWLDNLFISGCALVLMIIQTTTATRVSSGCTTLQGIGIMLSFIFISTMLGIL